jgi:predicted dehydrogenase
MKTLKVGIAGCGFTGHIHARSLELVKASQIGKSINPVIVGVADIDQAAAKSLQERHDAKHCFSDWRPLLDLDLDLLVVALPNNEHTEAVKLATEKNVAVLLEKPLAHTLKEAEMIYKIGSQNRCLRVGYVNRFVPAIQAIKQRIDQGLIGEVRMFTASYLLNMRKSNGPDSWRFDGSVAGHGATGDLASHYIDLIQFLVSDTASVQALSAQWHIDNAPKTSNDDTSIAMLQLSSGAIGTLTSSRATPGHSLTGTVEIFGTKGSLLFTRADLNAIYHRSENGDLSEIHVRPVEPFVSMWASPTVQGAHPFSWYDAFAFQMAETIMLAAGMRIENPWTASIEDAFKAELVADAIPAASSKSKIVHIKEHAGT